MGALPTRTELGDCIFMKFVWSKEMNLDLGLEADLWFIMIKNVIKLHSNELHNEQYETICYYKSYFSYIMN